MTRQNVPEPEQDARESGATLGHRFDFRPTDVIIAVMGVTGVGKSSFISLFTDEPVVIGHDLEACTSTVGIHQCSLRTGRRLFLIDTPGFDDTYKSDTDILREVANWLAEAYEHKIQLTGIVYLHRILDVRVGGSAMKNLRMFKKLCGEDGLESVVLATTMWSGVDEATALKREQELTTHPRFWAGMIAKGSTVFRHDRAIESAMEIVWYLIKKERPIIPQLAKEMVDDGIALDQTLAGKEVTAEMAEQKARFEQQLQQLKADMDEALDARDREWQKDVAREKAETEARLAKQEEERIQMQANWEALRREKDEELTRERELAQAQALEARERMLRHEHELARLKADHAHNTALQAQQFELDKTKAELRRREAEEESRGVCVVM